MTPIYHVGRLEVGGACNQIAMYLDVEFPCRVVDVPKQSEKKCITCLQPVKIYIQSPDTMIATGVTAVTKFHQETL